MTATDTVAALSADMTAAAAAAEAGPDILEEFVQRLCKSLSTEDAATVTMVRNILEPIFNELAEEYGASI